jgi:hypothetical protein
MVDERARDLRSLLAAPELKEAVSSAFSEAQTIACRYPQSWARPISSATVGVEIEEQLPIVPVIVSNRDSAERRVYSETQVAELEGTLLVSGPPRACTHPLLVLCGRLKIEKTTILGADPAQRGNVLRKTRITMLRPLIGMHHLSFDDGTTGYDQCNEKAVGSRAVHF